MAHLCRYDAISAVKKFTTSPDDTFVAKDIGISGGTLTSLCRRGDIILIGKRGRAQEYRINPNCRWLKGVYVGGGSCGGTHRRTDKAVDG